MTRTTHSALRFLILLFAACAALAPCRAQTQYSITSFALSASPNPIPSGSTTSLTATLHGSYYNPTGTVDFFTASGSCSAQATDLGTATLDSNGVALLTGVHLTASSQICASYSGDSLYPVATAGPFAVGVLPYTLSVSASAAPANFVYGQASAAAFSASLSRTVAADAAVPAGTVTFALTGAENVALGAAPLAQVAAPGAWHLAGPSTFDLEPFKMHAADLNRDGWVDVVGMPQYQQTGYHLQVLLANGLDGFQTQSTVSTGACNPQDFAIGDLNHDGIPDLAVLCYSNPPVAVYLLGNGNGTFQAPVAFAADSTLVYPTYLALGDFNGDGVLDVALADSYSSAIQVFTGGSSFGTFTAQPQISLSASLSQFQSIAAADFNQDGRSDLAILATSPSASNLSFTLAILTSDGAGGFSTALQPLPASISSYSYMNLAVTDINGDGFPDVAIADPGGGSTSSDTGNLVIFENNGSGALNPPFAYPAPNAGDVAGAPFPVTGKPASAAAPGATLVYASADYATGALSLTFLHRDSATSYTPVQTLLTAGTSTGGESGYQAGPLIVGDMNGDGYLDYGVFGVGPASSFQFIPAFYGNDSSATLASVTAQPNAGTYSLTAAYSGNALFAASTSPAVPVVISPATPGGIVSGPAASVFDQSVTFTASLTGVPGGTVPSGTVQFLDNGAALGPAQTLVSGSAALTTAALAVGRHAITAAYSGDVNYAALSPFGSTLIVVSRPVLTLTGITPATATLGAPATPITLTGTGFSTASQVLLGGSPIATTYVSATELRATIPAASLATSATLAVTVTDTGLTTASLAFTVSAPPVQVTLSGPGTQQPGQQSSLNFAVQQPYPVDIQGTFTLTVTPPSGGGPVDPAVQFATGGDTYTFTLAANSTATPPIQLQTGTLAATLTVTLTLKAGGTDVTPTSLQPVVIDVPASPPTISSVALARDGDTLTVTVQGFSSTRDMKNATFAFTPIAGASLQSPQITVDLSSAFTDWYAQPASIQYGSAFTYVQTFTLTNPASTLQSVDVTLANSAGNSGTRSAQ